MKNWKAVGYIFLGFGTVFFTFALCVFFGLMSTFSGTFLAQAAIPTSLAASVHWFVLAALMYVVGVVGHYAGKEDVATPTNLPKAKKHSSGKISVEWSFPVGVLATLAVLTSQYFSGMMSNPDRTVGFVFPIAISIVAGLIVGLAAYLLIDKVEWKG